MSEEIEHSLSEASQMDACPHGHFRICPECCFEIAVAERAKQLVEALSPSLNKEIDRLTAENAALREKVEKAKTLFKDAELGIDDGINLSDICGVPWKHVNQWLKSLTSLKEGEK